MSQRAYRIQRSGAMPRPLTSSGRSRRFTRSFIGKQNSVYIQTLLELGKTLQWQGNKIGAVPWFETGC